VEKIALTIAANAPLTVSASKIAFESLITAHGDYSAAEAAIDVCMKSDDYVEGRRAFMEKRKPQFRAK
jgi:enoyl-CoA hydratase